MFMRMHDALTRFVTEPPRIDKITDAGKWSKSEIRKCIRVCVTIETALSSKNQA